MQKKSIIWYYSSDRNNFITGLCNNLKGNTLCLYQLVEKHGKPLYELMKDFDRKVFFVYGGTDAKTRNDIRGIVEKEKNAIIIASYGTFSTGINIRNINNVVFSSPSKSRIRVLQSIGRGLRTSASKDSIRLFDLSDDLSYKSKINFTLNHFNERLNIYNEEQFNYKIDRIKTMSSYQIIKLKNGEDLICNVLDNENGRLKVSSPLKMETVNRISKKGLTESLAFTRWIQPYSDEEHFFIESNSIIIMTPASVGMTRYYEYVVKSYDGLVLKES